MTSLASSPFLPFSFTSNYILIFRPRTLPAIGVIFGEARDVPGTIRRRDVRRIYREIEKRSLPKFWIGDSTVELPSYWELKHALGNTETRKVDVLTKVWNGLVRFRLWIAKRMYKILPRPLKKIVKKIGRIEARMHKIVVCMSPRLKRRYGKVAYPEGLTVRVLKNQMESFFDFIKNGNAETEDVQYNEDCFADMERPKFGWRVKVSLKEDEPCNLDLDNPELSTCILTSGNNGTVAQSRQTGEQFQSAAPPDCRYRYICGENNQAQGNTPNAVQPIDDQANLGPFETNQVQANPAPANPADALPIQLPPQANNVQANVPPFEGNGETRANAIQAPPALPGHENPAPTIPENPSTVLDILGPQPPMPVQTNPVLPQQEDVKNKIAPEAPQIVLGPQDFYTPSSQDSLDVYKYYPYTTVHRT